MSDELETKVRGMLAGLGAERAAQIGAHRPDIIRLIETSLRGVPEVMDAKDVAFHLSHWNADAAFLVALHLFPERFTPEEIRSGVIGFLIHAPNHVAAAAKLGGSPTEDIFEVDALSGPNPD
ncbi:MAG TPA: hypothetical protein VMB21_00425 [Candidatus Limnocylindria bacterium]|jgi:hypothetical protein|nr:hypothetical protein [Candidatus Limnocylindria bacterium]